MGNGFGINGNFFRAIAGNTSRPQTDGVTQNNNYVSGFDAINKPASDTEVGYKELLGATFSSDAPKADEAFFSDADLAGLTDMAMTDTMATTVSGIEAMDEAGLDFDTLEGLDELTAMYTLDNYGNGTATRVQAGVETLDDIAGGNPELMDIAGLLFQDAAYTKATV